LRSGVDKGNTTLNTVKFTRRRLVQVEKAFELLAPDAKVAESIASMARDAKSREV